VTVDFALPRVRRYNFFMAQVSAIWCAGWVPVMAIAAAPRSPLEDLLVSADAFSRIPPLSASTTSSDLMASQSESSDRRTRPASPFIFSAQARASLSYPPHERARVRDGPAYWGGSAHLEWRPNDLLKPGLDLSLLRNNGRSKEKRIIHDAAFAALEPQTICPAISRRDGEARREAGGG
jgi:hypothetical protein